MTSPASSSSVLRTPLHALHAEAGARFVPFAGYEMPVQYEAGILAEHLHTRSRCSLFDVSHMGQATLIGASHAQVAAALETLVPGDIAGLAPSQQRYTQLLTDEGTIIDDLMVTARAEDGCLALVVNAARKAVDYAHLRAHLPPEIVLETHEERALLALQGPASAQVLAQLGAQGVPDRFMTGTPGMIAGLACVISRAGYTGEDGFEISVDAATAPALALALLGVEPVRWAGLGARDSLRLEAGLCLYGHDIDETTSPIEAQLQWSIQKRRRVEGGFPGFQRIRRELDEGPARKLVAIRPEGRAPAREGTLVLSEDEAEIGKITSGGFAPSIGGPVAMGYVASRHTAPGTPVKLLVRGTVHSARVARLPFVPHRYVKS